MPGEQSRRARRLGGLDQLTALKGLVKSTILSRVFNFIMAFNVMMAQNYLDFGSRNRMVMIKH